MTAIAVRKRMNVHQPMMETHSDFVGRKGRVFDPCPGVVEQLAQGHRNLMVREPKIALTCPELPGPSIPTARHYP